MEDGTTLLEGVVGVVGSLVAHDVVAQAEVQNLIEKGIVVILLIDGAELALGGSLNELTAASESVPRNLPTKNESAVL